MWRKNLWTLVAAVMLCGSSYTMIIPFLPIYLLELGVAQTDVKIWSGIIFSVTFLVAALLAPYWGRRADRSGKKKMIMRAGFSLAVVYFCGSLVHSPVELLGVRVLQGVANGFVPAAMAIVATSTPPDQLGFSMGIMQAGLVVGGIIGPLIGGVLSWEFFWLPLPWSFWWMRPLRRRRPKKAACGKTFRPPLPILCLCAYCCCPLRCRPQAMHCSL